MDEDLIDRALAEDVGDGDDSRGRRGAARDDRAEGVPAPVTKRASTQAR
jgi:hypothetical protein